MVGRCACALILVALIVDNSANGQSDAAGEYLAYPLKHKAAPEVEKMLAEMLSDLGETVQLVADTRGNQLLLRGPAKAQQIARQLIDSVDRPPPEETPPQESVVERYRIQKGDLAEMAAKLRSLFAQRDDVRVATDQERSQLLILAPRGVHTMLAVDLAQGRVPETLGQSEPERPDDGLYKEQSVALTKSTVDQLEPQLRELLGSRLEPLPTRRTVGPDYRFAGVAGRRVELSFDEKRNGIELSGSKKLVEQLARLIRALDGPRQTNGKQVLIVPVHRADPAKIQEAVEAYRGDPKHGRSVPSRLPGSPDSSRIERRIGGGIDLVHYLTQVSQEAAVGTAQPIPTTDKEVEVTEEELRALEESRERLRELGESVDIETLPDLNVIILRGPDRDLDEVSRIIAEIERLSVETEPVIGVYPLKHVLGESLVSVILEVSEDLIGLRQGHVSVSPLVKPNSLLLIGWGEAVEAVKELIWKLDTPVAPESQLRIFRLRHASADAATSTVEEAFQSRGGMGTDIQVVTETRTNSLIVRASPRDMVEVAHLIEGIDQGGTEAVNRARLIKLEHSLATDLAATLQSAIQAAAGGTGDRRSAVLELLTADVGEQRLLRSGILSDVEITPDAHTNTLIISGPVESMGLLTALIEQLDSPTGVAQIKVFKVVNGDANNLVLMLRTLLPSQTGTARPQLAGAEGESTTVPVRFSVDARTNSIIAAGSEGDLAIIEALLLRLDAEEVQERENEVYRLKNSFAPAIAMAVNEFLRSKQQLQDLAPGALSAFQQIESEVIVVPEQVTNSLIISATPRFFSEIMQLIEQLDDQPLQVLIQVLIAEVELNNVDEFGVELGLQDSVLFDRSLLGDLETTTRTIQQSTADGIVLVTEQIVQSATNTPGFDFNNNPLGNSGSNKALAHSDRVGAQGLSHFAMGRMNSDLNYGGLVLSAGAEGVSLLIRALRESRRMEVLGRPQIMTLDNQPAWIQVGKRVPRISESRSSFNQQTNSVVLENTGLILGVTPRISPDGMVVMEIDAEKSELGPREEGIPISIADGEVITSPSINVTMAQTTVSAASGETIVLGGLISKSLATVERRVPWLSRIPVLGNLFRYDNETERRAELLIILTPHVIRDNQDAERLKQVEAGRISWCLADVHAMHGPTGLYDDRDPSRFKGTGPVIYPDLNPHGLEPGEYQPRPVSPSDLELSPSIENLPIPTPATNEPPLPARQAWPTVPESRQPGTINPDQTSRSTFDAGEPSFGAAYDPQVTYTPDFSERLRQIPKTSPVYPLRNPDPPPYERRAETPLPRF